MIFEWHGAGLWYSETDRQTDRTASHPFNLIRIINLIYLASRAANGLMGYCVNFNELILLPHYPLFICRLIRVRAGKEATTTG